MWIKFFSLEQKGEDMTVKELKQYRSICCEIAEKETEIKEHTVCGTVVGSSPDFPFVKHTITVGGVEHSEKYAETMAQIQRLKRQKRRIERFISSISDSQTRRIFELRYIKGNYCPSWNAVAFAVGGGNTADGVRMRALRYLRQK